MWDDGCWMTDVFVVPLSAEAVVGLSWKEIAEIELRLEIKISVGTGPEGAIYISRGRSVAEPTAEKEKGRWARRRSIVGIGKLMPRDGEDDL